MKKPSLKINSRGFALAILIITVLFVTLSITYVTSLSLTTYNLATRDIYRTNAQMAADAALDIAMTTLNTTGTSAFSTSYNAETTLLTSGNITTTYQTALLDGSASDKKILSVISRTKVNGATKATRRYELDIQAVTSGSAGGSVVSGVGGLTLSANAKVSGGDVVVNGKITLANNSQIGLSTNPVNVRVAHQSCPNPADATYPQVCGSGNGQPITLGNNSKIYGNVQATNQTTGTNMSNPGLIPNSTFAPVSLPAFNRDAFKNTVNASGNTMTAAQAGNCTGSPKTVNWPANVKITGNISMANGCTVKINGNVWITGGVDISNLSTLQVQEGVGTTMPVLIVDGRIASGQNGGSPSFALSNNGKIQPNSQNTGIEVISYWANAACSPECTTLTGTDLANSQGVMTVDLGNNGSAPYSTFYAYWSKAQVSNNGALGAIAGQTVSLSNNAVITFTSSVPGSTNQITTWVKRGYMRVYQ